MELSSLAKVEVSTFEQNKKPYKVTVKILNNNEVSVEETYQKVTKEIGLHSFSLPHFALFQGKDKPTQRYKGSQTIPLPAKDLSIQKWCFDPKVENNKLLNDPLATHLLYTEAQAGIQSGRLKPTSDEQHKLDEFLEPGFVLENQYVCACQRIHRYWSRAVPQCTVMQEFRSTSLALQKGTEITLHVGRDGLEIDTADNSYLSSWHHLKSWSRNSSSIIQFEILIAGTKTNTLKLETCQTDLVLAMVVEIIKVLQSEDAEAPPFLTSMIKTSDDVMTHWNNVLYNPQKMDN